MMVIAPACLLISTGPLDRKTSGTHDDSDEPKDPTPTLSL